MYEEGLLEDRENCIFFTNGIDFFLGLIQVFIFFWLLHSLGLPIVILLGSIVISAFAMFFREQLAKTIKTFWILGSVKLLVSGYILYMGIKFLTSYSVVSYGILIVSLLRLTVGIFDIVISVIAQEEGA